MNKKTRKHELTKLDAYLGIPEGCTYVAIVENGCSEKLMDALEARGISINDYGIVSKADFGKWRELCIAAGVSRAYWKSQDDLQLYPVEITDLTIDD